MTKLTFRDEFNTLSLWNGSSGTWQPSYDWAANGLNVGTSWFVNPMYGPTSAADDNVYSVSNGALSIAIKPTPSDAAAATGNTPFLSGQLETKPTFSQLYGYFEINAVLPSGGTGISSAFWLLPENGSWPPELDVFEQDTSQGLNAVETGVFTNQSGSTQQIYSWDYNLPNLAAAPHTYAVDWEVNTITWYIDGQQVFQTATPADMHQPMYMLIDDLTTAVGSWNGSPAAGLNTSMQVNWVHAYDSNPYVNGVNSVLGGTATNPGTGTTGGSTGTTTGGTTGGTTGTTTGGTTSGQPVLITPGVGTFKDAAGNAYTLSAAGDALENGVLMNGGSGTGAMELANGVIYAQDAASKTWYTWNQTTWTQASAAPPAVTTGGGTTVPPPPPPPPTSTSHFTVSATGGFVDANGHTWTMRGLNAGVQDALQGFANVLTDYPGLTAIRLNTGGNDSAADIDKVVQEYTARGVVVMIEDHSGTANNVAWYQQMATTYKGNALVFLEMPNEPNATNLSQIQIGLVNAIRAAGFTNPIALQPAGGYDFSNIAAVTAAVGTNNIFITPHIYYSGTDPNGAAQYVANDISTSLSLGLFPSIDEFGDAMDGWNRDPYGAQVISSVIAANEAGKAGAVFWAMDNGNHPNGADSAFLNTSGTQLTPVGVTIQPWLSQPTTPGGGGGITTPVVTGTGPDSLVLAICEDYYQGDAQFTVTIDGKQVGGTFTAGAWHSAGQEQLFTFNGTFAPGNHTLSVAFLNDAWGGSAMTDRNLYVDSIKFDGTDTKQSMELGGTGAQNFTFVGLTPPPVVNPLPVTVGTGSDSLVLKFSEAAFQGDAQFTVSVDGKQLGGTYTETASHALGADQTFTFNGDWAVGSHTVSVNFLNDLQVANTGDRNLYMDSAVYDGVNTGKTLALLGTGPMTFSVTDTTAVPGAIIPSANDSLVLAGSAAAITDAAGHRWTISTTNTVLEDGKAANFTANVAAIAYVNNAMWHENTSSQWYDWTSSGWVSGSNPLPAPKAAPVPAFDFTTGVGSDTLVLKISEDAYQGNAQFTVSVDGKQLGRTFTATALHASAADKTFAFNGDFGTGAHAVAVNFLNDAWGGSSALDRNLYVDAITYKGVDTKQAAELAGTGVENFTVSGGTVAAVTETGDHGSLSKTLSQTGSYTVGSDTFVLTAGNAATVTLGTGTSQIKFLGDSALTLTGGAGTATVTADGGTNKFVAGAGTLDVTGGGGKDAYVFHANGGLLKIEDFASAKGDTLTVDKALQGSMLQASDGAGGTLLTFGAGAAHGVDFRGVVAIPANVLWA